MLNMDQKVKSINMCMKINYSTRNIKMKRAETNLKKKEKKENTTTNTSPTLFTN
jgi:hypothetical protein